VVGSLLQLRRRCLPVILPGKICAIDKCSAHCMACAALPIEYAQVCSAILSACPGSTASFSMGTSPKASSVTTAAAAASPVSSHCANCSYSTSTHPAQIVQQYLACLPSDVAMTRTCHVHIANACYEPHYLDCAGIQHRGIFCNCTCPQRMHWLGSAIIKLYYLARH